MADFFSYQSRVALNSLHLSISRDPQVFALPEFSLVRAAAELTRLLV